MRDIQGGNSDFLDHRSSYRCGTVLDLHQTFPIMRLTSESGRTLNNPIVFV